jgi:hypothetical protein
MKREYFSEKMHKSIDAFTENMKNLNIDNITSENGWKHILHGQNGQQTCMICDGKNLNRKRTIS